MESKENEITREKIFKFEKGRTNENLLICYFFNDESSFYNGDFYHAYDWSAYLCTHLNTEKILKAFRTSFSESKDDVAMVGLKMNNFDGFFGSLKEKNQVLIHKKWFEFDVKGFLNENPSIEDYQEKLKEWRDALKYIEPKDKVKKKKEKTDKKNEMFKKLKETQIASMNPIECMVFLCELQKALFDTE